MSELEHLRFLDISFAKQVTDGGLAAFHDKHQPIRRLFINGLKLATSVGLSHIFHCV